MAACVDSRVDPAMIFDSAAGGDSSPSAMIANLVPPYEKDCRLSRHQRGAGIFGVRVLSVEHIIVLGHGLCGGMSGFARRAHPGDAHADDFVGSPGCISPKRRARFYRRDKCLVIAAPEERQLCCEQEAIKISLDQTCMTFPWIAERVRAGRVICMVCGSIYRNGELMRVARRMGPLHPRRRVGGSWSPTDCFSRWNNKFVSSFSSPIPWRESGGAHREAMGG